VFAQLQPKLSRRHYMLASGQYFSLTRFTIIAHVLTVKCHKVAVLFSLAILQCC